jgi:hypothetical protein
MKFNNCPINVINYCLDFFSGLIKISIYVHIPNQAQRYEDMYRIGGVAPWILNLRR